MVTQRIQADRGRSNERSDESVSPSRPRSTSKERTLSIQKEQHHRRTFLGLTLFASALFCVSLSQRESNRLDSPLPNSSNLRSTFVDSQCRIYLAESSIPNGGLGIFTSEFIPRGAQIGRDPGLCIQVHIPRSGANQLYSHTHGNSAFFWNAERGARQLCPGISTIANTQMAKSNMELTALTRPSNAGLTRLESPGAGAISHNYGQYHVALKNIPAGVEVTIDYGDWTLPDKETKVEKRIMPHRPLSFLREHGMCMDNIEVQPSLLPHAGRGAFATRAISTGDLVAPAPLIIIKDKNRLDQNELLRNYMFEVEGSDTMAFVPYGEGVNFINHSSKKPNVGLRWSTNKFHRSDFLDLSEKDFWRKAWPGALILEVYALRFLRPGEELVMDYGSAWEQAWNDHVQHWNSKRLSEKGYVYPSELDETMVLRTVKEQETKPYPPNVATVCFTPSTKSGKWLMPKDNREWEDSYYWCHVLDKEYDEKEEEFLYTVSVQSHSTSNYHEYDSSVPETKQQILTKVPRHAIRWENKPYQSDQFLKDSFRHSMAFPEDLFPKQWKSSTSMA